MPQQTGLQRRCLGRYPMEHKHGPDKGMTMGQMGPDCGCRRMAV